jgi:hypothetical protein
MLKQVNTKTKKEEAYNSISEWLPRLSILLRLLFLFTARFIRKFEPDVLPNSFFSIWTWNYIVVVHFSLSLSLSIIILSLLYTQFGKK